MLKRHCASKDHLVRVYCTIIRPVVEYACQAWHPGLTQELTKHIELVQKRALRIICPVLSYTEALEKYNLLTLEHRRRELCANYYNKIKKDKHKLHALLPQPRYCAYNLRKCSAYERPRLRTNRAKHSFINWALSNLQ